MSASSIASALGGLAVSADVRERLERYLRALLLRNATMNLTGAQTAEALADHVQDSLALADFVRSPLVDIGSGGGFPAIPLAIGLGCRVTLVESVAKKATFLREVVTDLDLPVEVVCARAEELGRDGRYRGQYASATARAVSGMTTVLELTVPLLAVGGVALLQRGAFTALERDATSDALLVLGATLEDEVALPTTPTEQATTSSGRRLVVVRKQTETSVRFPRRAGIPAKRPLGVRVNGAG